MGRCQCVCGCDNGTHRPTGRTCNTCSHPDHKALLIAAGELAPTERPQIETKVVKGIRHTTVIRIDGSSFTVQVPPRGIKDSGAVYKDSWIREGKQRPRKNQVVRHVDYLPARLRDSDKRILCKVVGHNWFSLTYPPDPRLWRCTRCGLIVDSID